MLGWGQAQATLFLHRRFLFLEGKDADFHTRPVSFCRDLTAEETKRLEQLCAGPDARSHAPRVIRRCRLVDSGLGGCGGRAPFWQASFDVLRIQTKQLLRLASDGIGWQRAVSVQKSRVSCVCSCVCAQAQVASATDAGKLDHKAACWCNL